MAWIGMLRFVDLSLRNVRWTSGHYQCPHARRAQREIEDQTMTRAGKNPLDKGSGQIQGTVWIPLARHLREGQPRTARTRAVAVLTNSNEHVWLEICNLVCRSSNEIVNVVVGHMLVLDVGHREQLAAHRECPEQGSVRESFSLTGTFDCCNYLICRLDRMPDQTRSGSRKSFYVSYSIMLFTSDRLDINCSSRPPRLHLNIDLGRVDGERGHVTSDDHVPSDRRAPMKSHAAVKVVRTVLHLCQRPLSILSLPRFPTHLWSAHVLNR